MESLHFVVVSKRDQKGLFLTPKKVEKKKAESQKKKNLEEKEKSGKKLKGMDFWAFFSIHHVRHSPRIEKALNTHNRAKRNEENVTEYGLRWVGWPCSWHGWLSV